MWLLLGVFIGGGTGALTRMAVDAALTRRWSAKTTGARRTFPIGTFVINVTGAALLGVITGFVAAHGSAAAHDLSAVAGTGFCGAYTTFSTEEWQTLGLRRAGRGMESLSLIGSLAASLALAGFGLWLGGRI